MVDAQVGTRKAVTIAHFVGIGLYNTFRPLYLSTVISPDQIGSILFLGSVICSLVNPVISAVFDKLQAQKALVQLATLGEALTQIAMVLPGQGYVGMLIWNTLHSLAGAHHSPTFDASTMMVCPERYGEIRLLGSAAFGLAAFGGGALMSIVNPNLTYLASFGAASAIQVLSMPLISRLDFSMLHAKKQDKSSGSGKGEIVDAGPKLSELLKTCMSPKMLFVVVVTFLCGWESALIDVFFNVHLSNIGAPGVLMGTARLLTCLAELPAFRMSSRILKALGVSGSFALAQVAYVVRFLWYVNLQKIAKLGPWGIWAVLPIELLHGITFAINWSALTAHATRVAPPGFASAMQQLVNTVHWGLARGVGATVGGRILGSAGGERMYLIGTYQAVSTLILICGGRACFGRDLLGHGVSIDDAKQQ